MGGMFWPRFETSSPLQGGLQIPLAGLFWSEDIPPRLERASLEGQRLQGEKPESLGSYSRWRILSYNRGQGDGHLPGLTVKLRACIQVPASEAREFGRGGLVTGPDHLMGASSKASLAPQAPPGFSRETGSSPPPLAWPVNIQWKLH